MKLSPSLSSRRTRNDSAPEDESWVDREVAGCKFKDARLGERFGKLLKQIGSAIGQAIPFACQDWANTKAAYRFFSNDRVDEEAILSGHFQLDFVQFWGAPNGLPSAGHTVHWIILDDLSSALKHELHSTKVSKSTPTSVCI
jgi:hypothetical protein